MTGPTVRPHPLRAELTLRAFRAHLDGQYRPQTIRAYTRQVRRLLSALETENLTAYAVTGDWIDRWIASLPAPQRKPAHGACRQLNGWLRGQHPDLPFWPGEAPTQPYAPPTPRYAPRDVQALLDAAAPEEAVVLHFTLCWQLGLAETLTLSWSHVDFDRNLLTLPGRPPTLIPAQLRTHLGIIRQISPPTATQVLHYAGVPAARTAAQRVFRTCGVPYRGLSRLRR